MNDINTLLNEQISYYQARSQEYNEWFFRQGRYDRGKELNQQWFNEIEQVRLALKSSNPTGHVLEIACGTGLWTKQIVRFAKQVTALDAASEMIAINQAYVRSPLVRYVHTDIFNWDPKEKFDFIFFGFWLSHVPLEKFNSFWNIVELALKPYGCVFFVDSKYNTHNAANVYQIEGFDTTITERELNNGRVFQIIKILYERNELINLLGEFGWEFNIQETENYCIYGSGYKKS